MAADAGALARSVHGAKLSCISCHTQQSELPHRELSVSLPQWRTRLARACANCHPDASASYAATSHGKLAALGSTETALCTDCHGGHTVLAANAADSPTSPARRLDTCRGCHPDASAGFAGYLAHASTGDFARYPQLWLAAKSMAGILVFTFALFWTYAALWLYREFRDRQARVLRQHVRAEALPKDLLQVRRWSSSWRAAHLVFAVSVIILVATGIPLLYSQSMWAPWLIGLFGGTTFASLVHKVSAVVMLVVFAGHLGYVAVYLARNRKTFQWFGPYSLLPNLQDLQDIAATGRWLVGRGPRPEGDHWNFMQKADYWFPFWGITILTLSGAMLWFKALTGTWLPGWVFNVATLVHGEDALLAAVYLFTIHYFANHWRPDKFPMDLVMFTGSMPIEEFKREYALEYARLAKSGELERYLVRAPTQPMTLGSQILGFTLVAIGLALLVMMATGFAHSLGMS